AYGVDTQLFKGGPSGEKVNAVGWMCYNYPLSGEQMLFVNRGKLEARRGPGLQGHYGQFLAILAQSHVKSDYPMLVNNKSFTLNDLIEHEKANCFAGEELTFKLIALMHYLDSDETWNSRDGQQWSIQRLVREELKQPIRGAACGGTHRLMGFSYAVNKRIQRGKPIEGQFQRAQTFLRDYHAYTFSLQNPDGSFSTEWFVRRGDTPDIDRRLKTSGHILEWIAFSLSEPELRDPRTIKAVDYVATLLLKNEGHTWEIGPLGHGLHALAIYNSRMFTSSDAAWPQDIVASRQALDATTLEARRSGQSQ
ncbi:MAG TPA: ADP-ribosylation factor-directed GTPase activating protein isoform b, partial [Pirellulales bacterium]|nr:ADP-ribosylation factor-directed GTPase activating protein isoform b [Pirellulales bacterium]